MHLTRSFSRRQTRSLPQISCCEACARAGTKEFSFRKLGSVAENSFEHQSNNLTYLRGAHLHSPSQPPSSASISTLPRFLLGLADLFMGHGRSHSLYTVDVGENSGREGHAAPASHEGESSSSIVRVKYRCVCEGSSSSSVMSTLKNPSCCPASGDHLSGIHLSKVPLSTESRISESSRACVRGDGGQMGGSSESPPLAQRAKSWCSLGRETWLRVFSSVTIFNAKNCSIPAALRARNMFGAVGAVPVGALRGLQRRCATSSAS